MKCVVVVVSIVNLWWFEVFELFKWFIVLFDGVVIVCKIDVGVLIDVGSGNGVEFFIVLDVWCLCLYIYVL